jgi:tetratricopeptide (TPR) repeat protein
MLAAQRLTNVDCCRFLGDVYDHRGEWPRAEQAFAAGIARASSLPQAYSSWGNALLGHQRYPAAIEKLAAAHERGPHWADPLECWAEALAAQGKFREAAQKYAEAASGSPPPEVRCACTGRGIRQTRQSRTGRGAVSRCARTCTLRLRLAVRGSLSFSRSSLAHIRDQRDAPGVPMEIALPESRRL